MPTDHSDSSSPDTGSPTLRYAIIGAGAVGGLYGGMLARQGAEVHFLVRGDLDAIRRQGWIIESVRGNFELPGERLNLHNDPASIPPCDVAIIGLKTTQNHLLSQLLTGAMSGDGVVLCLQNGLHSEQASADVVGPDRVLGGCCFLCSNKLATGHIRHIDYGQIVIGEFTPAAAPPAGVTPRLQRIVDDLCSAGIDAKATGDLWAARWRKLLWNIPFNGLSVVLNATSKQLIDDPQSAAIAQSLMEEVAQAAAANDRPLPADAIAKTLAHTRQMVPYDSSMRLDHLAGREMELQAILGDPIKAGQARGLAMPRVEMLHRQLRFLQAVF